MSQVITHPEPDDLSDALRRHRRYTLPTVRGGNGELLCMTPWGYEPAEWWRTEFVGDWI